MKKWMLALFLLILVGCGAQTKPTGAQSLSPVYTDWSKLTPYEPVIQQYTLHDGYCVGGALAERDDYGVLLPYIGVYSVVERYVIDALPMYGLVNDRGELVSDPVYAQIRFDGEFMELYRRTDDESDPEHGFALTLAAADGRWVRELSGSSCLCGGFGLMVTAGEDQSLTIWNADGEAVGSFDRTQFTPWLGENFIWGEEDLRLELADDQVIYIQDFVFDHAGEWLYLDRRSGTVSDTPPEGYPADFHDLQRFGETPEAPEIEGCSFLTPLTDQITGETYFEGYVNDGYALFDQEGNLRIEKINLSWLEAAIIVRAGLCSTVEGECFCFRAVKDNALVFRYAIRSNSD